jgi:hypothetical protein
MMDKGRQWVQCKRERGTTLVNLKLNCNGHPVLRWIVSTLVKKSIGGSLIGLFHHVPARETGHGENCRPEVRGQRWCAVFFAVLM